MDISALKIPPAKVNQFKKKGIETVEQLLTTYPRRYKDYRQRTPLSEISKHVGEPITVCGEICRLRANYEKGLVMCSLTDSGDGKNNYCNVTWFNQTFLMKKLYNGCRIAIHGKLAYNAQYHSYNIAGPTYLAFNIEDAASIVPVYPVVKGMAEEYYRDCLVKAKNLYNYAPSILRNPINTQTEANLGILPQKEFIRIVHHPKTDKDLKDIELREAAEILVPFAKELAEKEAIAAAPRYTKFDEEKTSQMLHKIESSLPYQLTEDQHRAVEVLIEDVKSGKRINALIQGDVGCGKTIVAIIVSALFAVNGYQSVIMTPTKILASQHYSEFSKVLANTGIHTVFLAEGLKVKEREKILDEINRGEAAIVVGTSSVLSDKVTFRELGLLITDEEHRFGVAQRELLLDRAKNGVHCISMSANPIPRSLALAVNGNSTKIVDIKAMPAGRKPVKTILYGNEEKTYDAMYRQIKEGHQCYIVCPLIDKSDAESMEGVESVEDTLAKAKKYFETHYQNVTIAAITGKTNKKDQQQILDDFTEGKLHILIATTIVEVGVNISNATVMVIKNAERFGLAQLHQLRGRVGRSSTQSYCVLLSQDKANERLLTMVRTNDGFEIAKADLEQRGAGNLIGVEQSGFNEVLTCMMQHPGLYKAIQNEIGKTM